jgi:hypothetical protein
MIDSPTLSGKTRILKDDGVVLAEERRGGITSKKDVVFGVS